MSAIQTIDLTCPNCELEFTSRIMDAAPAHGRKRTDFRLNADGAGLSYGVHLCERCGFAGRRELFSVTNPVSYEVRQHVWDELAPRLVDSAPTASEKYEFAAKVAAWDGVPCYEVADLWLRAAWCCADEGDIEAERYYRRHAAWQFEESLAGYETVDRESRPVVTYLVAELWRRIGDSARANAWFERVTDEIVDERSQEWLVQLAKQQQDDPQEWFV